MCVRIQTPKRQAACSLTLRGGGAVGFPGLFRCSVVAHFEPSGLICAQTISRDGTSAQMPGEWGGGPHQQMCSDMENGRPAVQPTATATGSQAAAAVGRPARAPPQKASRGPAACRRVVKLEEAHGIRCRQNMLLVLENTWAGCVRAVWAPTPNSARLGGNVVVASGRPVAACADTARDEDADARMRPPLGMRGDKAGDWDQMWEPSSWKQIEWRARRVQAYVTYLCLSNWGRTLP